MIGQRLTAIPGSSGFMRGGVIAYHDDIKADILGVDRALLKSHGAVSEAVAKSMAEGVRRLTDSDYGLSVTGIAGPDGGTPEKPVGLVFVAVAGSTSTEVRQLNLGGGRDTIREASATLALDLLRKYVQA
jgi:nicotinamide-nucleotide amidase